MALLFKCRLMTIVCKQNSVNIFNCMFTTTNITANIETRISKSSIFPIDEIDFLIINKEIHITSITMNITESYSISLS